MASICVAFCRCRIQFIPHGQQRAQRDYSDRSLVELRQYDFADYAVRALDIENKNQEIFAVPLKGQNEYKCSGTSTAPDEIQGSAGAYYLWLNADSRAQFYDSLNTAIEERKLIGDTLPDSSVNRSEDISTASRYDNQNSFRSNDRDSQRSSDRDSTRPTYRDDRDSTKPTYRDDRDSTRPTYRDDRDSTKPTYRDDRDLTKPTYRDDRDSTRPTYRDDRDSTKPTYRDDRDSTKPTYRDDRDSTKPTYRDDRDSTRPTYRDDRDSTKPTYRDDRDSTKPTYRDDRDSTKPTYRDDRESIRPNQRDDRDSTRSTQRDDRDPKRPAQQDDRESIRPNQRDDRDDRDPTRSNRQDERDALKSYKRDNEDDRGVAGSKGRNQRTLSESSGQPDHNNILADVYQLGEHIRRGRADDAVELAKKLSKQRVQLEANEQDSIDDEQAISIRIKIDSNNTKTSGKFPEQTMSVYPSTTIAQLRAAFEHTQHFPPTNQYFFVNGHLAHDKSTMKDLAIHDDILFVLFVIE